MAKPKLALIPAAQGTKFYSVLPSDGVGDFDFTRGSSATRINAQGLIETVADTSSRLNYDLLNGKVVNCPHYLLEPASTNAFAYSEDFNQSYWTKQDSSIISNQAVSPDGALNADLYTSSSDIYDFVRTIVAFTSGQTHTLSIFVKSGTSNEVRLDFPSAFTDRSAIFNLDNKTYTAVNGSPISKIEDYGNGWFRCSITATATSTSSGSTGFSSTKPMAVSTLYLWGAMLEQSSYPTSYIPTTTGQVTRAAETADGSGDAATFNDSEGVLMFEGSFVNDTSFKGISISNGTIANNIRIYHSTTDNQLVFRVRVGDVDQALILYTLNDTSLYNKISFKYKENDFNVFINGFKLLTDDSGSTFASGVLNQLNFNRGDGLDPFYGNTREVQYFDSALTDAQLETLTSWTSLQEMITSQLYTNY